MTSRSPDITKEIRMKRIFTLMLMVIFLLGFAGLGFAGVEKCDKCHKGEKSIDKMVAKSKIASAADLTKALRQGPKAGMHKALADEDIAAAATSLKLK
jgi:hypothetical protein